MIDVHRRAEIVVEGLHLREREGIIGHQLGLRKALRNVDENRRRFGQGATVRHQCRHPPLRIDRKILRGCLLAVLEIEALRRIGSAGLFQSDMRSQRTGAGGVIELEHADPFSGEPEVNGPAFRRPPE